MSPGYTGYNDTFSIVSDTTANHDILSKPNPAFQRTLSDIPLSWMQKKRRGVTKNAVIDVGILDEGTSIVPLAVDDENNAYCNGENQDMAKREIWNYMDNSHDRNGNMSVTSRAILGNLRAKRFR